MVEDGIGQRHRAICKIDATAIAAIVGCSSVGSVLANGGVGNRGNLSCITNISTTAVAINGLVIANGTTRHAKRGTDIGTAATVGYVRRTFNANGTARHSEATATT